MSTACNRTYTADVGHITSPRWPNNYPQSVFCQTNIITAPGNKLSLYFGTFEMEHHDLCRYDYLQVLNSRIISKFPFIFHFLYYKDDYCSLVEVEILLSDSRWKFIRQGILAGILINFACQFWASVHKSPRRLLWRSDGVAVVATVCMWINVWRTNTTMWGIKYCLLLGSSRPYPLFILEENER